MSVKSLIGRRMLKMYSAVGLKLEEEKVSDTVKVLFFSLWRVLSRSSTT